MEYEVDDPESEEEDRSIPADPSVRNFSFTVVDGEIYYRENSIMHPVDLSVTGVNRVKGLIAIRECVRKLIEYQTEDYPDIMIQQEQANLNTLYDAFEKKYSASIPEQTNQFLEMIVPSACFLHWKFWMMRGTSFVRQICSASAQSGSIPKLPALIPHRKLWRFPWAKRQRSICRI